MASYGQTTITFNDTFFDRILQSQQVEALTSQAAGRVLSEARASAPVDTGSYRDQLTVERVQRAHRATYMVVGHDPKTLLIESRTQNLARALKKART